jgi:methyl-accepting chemotaxis protein
MTQQNAALVEQSAAAAQSLKDQADRLAEAVAAFKVSQVEAKSVIESAQVRTAAKAPVRTPVPNATPAKPMPAKAVAAGHDNDAWEEF